jgi:hypothetical protein
MPTDLFWHTGEETEMEHEGAKAHKRLTAWVENPAACGGLKPLSVKADSGFCLF